MIDARRYDPIQGQGQGHEPLKVGNPSIFKRYLLCHLQRELATNHWFLNLGTISKFVWAKFFIFVLVFVSRDLELGRNVSCEESTFNLVWGCFISNYCSVLFLHLWLIDRFKTLVRLPLIIILSVPMVWLIVWYFIRHVIIYSGVICT